jgi:hypothetical protein
VLNYFATIAPEQLGVPEQVTFKIPLEDGSELVLMFPKSYAQQATAAHLSTDEFLSRMLQSVLQQPMAGPINTINSWHFSGPIPIQRPVKVKRRDNNARTHQTRL